jgi:hypothetical protein
VPEGSPIPTPPGSRAAVRAVPRISHSSVRGSLTFRTVSAEGLPPQIAAHPRGHTPFAHPLPRGPKTPPPSDHLSPPLGGSPGGEKVTGRGVGGRKATLLSGVDRLRMRRWSLPGAMGDRSMSDQSNEGFLVSCVARLVVRSGSRILPMRVWFACLPVDDEGIMGPERRESCWFCHCTYREAEAMHHARQILRKRGPVPLCKLRVASMETCFELSLA